MPPVLVTRAPPSLTSFRSFLLFFFFFNDTAPTEIYTLSLHDALPIYRISEFLASFTPRTLVWSATAAAVDRKSTRLNSSHGSISYAVFCLKNTKRRLVSARARRSARPSRWPRSEAGLPRRGRRRAPRTTTGARSGRRGTCRK